MLEIAVSSESIAVISSDTPMDVVSFAKYEPVTRMFMKYSKTLRPVRILMLWLMMLKMALRDM